MALKLVSESDWQLECGEVKQRAANVLQTGQWSDCAFLVGHGPDQMDFKAHKLILAMASPVFEAMLYGSMAEGNGPIFIPDIPSEAFRKLLVYIYTDEIELDSVTSACDLYYGAQKYMLPHVMKVCTTYISCNLSPQSVTMIHKFAELVGEKELLNESLQMIRLEAKTVLEDSSFVEMDIDTVLEVFKMDPLNIDSELDLYAAAERYAKVLDKREDDQNEEAGYCHVDEEAVLDAEDSEYVFEVHASGSGENNQTQTNAEVNRNDDKRASIHTLLQQIRFLTLTAKQLAEYKTLSSLLTESDILALLMNIASSNTHMPMPTGFSTSRELRDRIPNRVQFYRSVIEEPAFEKYTSQDGS